MSFASKYKSRIRIEKPTKLRDPDYNTQKDDWQRVTEGQAEIQDAMPSKSETAKNSMRTNTQQCRVRMRRRDDITSTMRLVELTGAKRTMAIVSAIAVIGERCDEIEFMCEMGVR